MELHGALSDREIIEFCVAASSKDIISGHRLGNLIYKLSNRLVIKRGGGVTETEAENQRRAFKLLDPNIVRVPEVYRFFTYRGEGFLVMEFVEGKVLEQLNDVHYEKLAIVLSHFHSIHGKFAGNLQGHGSLYFCPFPDEGVPAMNTLQMEQWFNSRRRKNSPPRVCFQNSELVFTHRDLAPRNLIWQDDGSVYLLDWSTAGFFPPSVEICSQRGGIDPVFNDRLEMIIQSISSVDHVEIDGILEAWSNCTRYHL